MENSLLINYNGNPLVVILVHNPEFLSVNQILDVYAEKAGFLRKSLTGRFIDCIDITRIDNGIFVSVGSAQNDWGDKSPEENKNV